MLGFVRRTSSGRVGSAEAKAASSCPQGPPSSPQTTPSPAQTAVSVQGSEGPHPGSCDPAVTGSELFVPAPCTWAVECEVREAPRVSLLVSPQRHRVGSSALLDSRAPTHQKPSHKPETSSSCRAEQSSRVSCLGSAAPGAAPCPEPL